MKTHQHITNYILLFCFGILGTPVVAQQKLVMNGGYINIANGANLVIGNSATDALTRNTGYIITEGQNNNVVWNMGTTTGTYTVPLGYNSSYIPVTFTKSAGVGNGSVTFSSYHTGWNNSAMLPTGVLNVNFNGVDNSAYTIDRFWKIGASGYTTKPTLTNFTLTYIDAEFTATGNYITEGQMGMQRWNSTINDWGDFIPGVTIDQTLNKITVPTVSSANFYSWWTMPAMNGGHALPVELISFKGRCDNGISTFTWSTASEQNNDHFTLERSPDGVNWITVKTIKGAGNSNKLLSYSATDETAIATDNYYRLKQFDTDSKKATFSPIIRVSCNASTTPSPAFTMYPNPSVGYLALRNVPEGASVNIFNPIGEIVYSEKLSSADTDLNLQDLSNGIYLVSINTGTSVTTNKLIIQK